MGMKRKMKRMMMMKMKRVRLGATDFLRRAEAQILTLKNKPPGRARGRARATEVLSPGRGGDYFLEPSVAQPPLPLQEFLPLQPLSPVLQPPLPLQEFLPAQSCLSAAPPFFSAITPAFAV